MKEYAHIENASMSDAYFLHSLHHIPIHCTSNDLALKFT